MNNVFVKIYKRNKWKYGSGEGSLVIHTNGYVTFLENFMQEHQVRSVVDMGCGDWQFSRNIHWGNARYHGFDVVPSVIEENTRNFSSDTIEFQLYSGNPAELPSADLLIVKDVLQHLPNRTIFQFIAVLSRFKYTLITNCVNPRGRTRNRNVWTGGFRYLDLRLPPFNLPATEVYQFTKNARHLNSGGIMGRFFQRPLWLKKTLLVKTHEQSK